MMPTDPITSPRRGPRCSSPRWVSPPAPPTSRRRRRLAPDTVVARFAPGGEVSVIVVSVSDRRPLRQRRADRSRRDDRAGRLGRHRQTSRSTAISRCSPRLRPAVLAASASAPAPPPFPVPLTGAAPEMTGLSNGQIQSTALLRLPDPLGYRLEWQAMAGAGPDRRFRRTSILSPCRRRRPPANL